MKMMKRKMRLQHLTEIINKAQRIYQNAQMEAFWEKEDPVLHQKNLDKEIEAMLFLNHLLPCNVLRYKVTLQKS